MAIDRRQLLISLLASAAASVPSLAGAGPRFVSCRMDARNEASVCIFDLDGRELFSTRLPARGHDTAMRPESGEFVAFARRPGNWFVAVDRQSGQVNAAVVAAEHRHFYGHGAFSADGRLLYATENNLVSGDGVIGIYDATRGYARIGEFPSGGIGPHDVCLTPRKPVLIVANGGLRTHPATGRETLNPADMKPNLALLDARDGAVLGRIELADGLRKLSIRHLAVASDGSACFGCQHEGDADEQPPLVGTLSPGGKIALFSAPDDALRRMQNYVGSVCLDGSESFIAATSPRGGQVMIWDRGSGRLAKTVSLFDVCGIAAAAPGTMIASSGNAGIRCLRADDGSRCDSVPMLLNWIWDNHLRRV